MKRILVLFAFLFVFLSYSFAEKITFKTADGVQIVGEYFKPISNPQAAIILLHGLGSGKEEWNSFAQLLAARGFGVLTYDARGHGESKTGGPGRTVDYQTFYGRGLNSDWGKMVDDLRIAVQTLSKKYKLNPKTIAVGGASIGANIAFRYAVGQPETPFALLLSPGIDYQGLTTKDLVTGYGKRPLCMAVSPPDRYSYQSVMLLQSLNTSLQAGGANLMVLVEESNPGHGTQMFKRTSANKPSPLEEQLLKWIQKHK